MQRELKIREKEGFAQILEKLSDEEVTSLRDTVTKRQVTTEGKIEAINAILTFTETPLGLLRRKKLRRDLLFQYLIDNRVRVSVTAGKEELIRQILDYWGSKYNIKEIEDFLSKECVSDSNSSTSLDDGEKYLPSTGNQAQPLSSVHSVNNGDHRSAVSVSRQGENTAQAPRVTNTLPSKEVTTVPESSSNQVTCQGLPDEKFELGKQFVQWFYKILNSHNPTLQNMPDGEFGPQHFWSDCRLEIKTAVGGEANSENYEGAAIVAFRFLALVKEEKLLFNPNVTSEGIRVKSEPHGLVLVMTCGTLHRISECLGVFEQVFGLVSDPTLDNNWKVKMSQLKMKSSQHAAMPKLDSSEQILAIGSSS